MGGVIAFRENNDESPLLAGWAFRQILDDVASQNRSDFEMIKEFERAEAIGGLLVYSLPPNLAARMTTAITTGLSGILSGEVRSGLAGKPYGDARTVEQYHGALRELLKAIPSSR